MVEERSSSLNKCGLPTCRHAPTKGAPSSFRDVIDAASVPKVTGENTVGGEINVPANYCSKSCFQASVQFYNSLDESAPVTRKHAAQLIAAATSSNSSGNCSPSFFFFAVVML